MSGFSIQDTERSTINRKGYSEETTITANSNNISTSKSRSFGAEYVSHCIWKELELPEKLKELGLSARERSLAEGVVIGRLVNPGSELATWDWIRNISSIEELTEEVIEKTALNPVYYIGDTLVKYKADIEDHLFKKEKKMYPNRSMLYLFDLTNFYFEGQALCNSLAKRGKSKEKRNDCPLVSVGLVVDSDGFPVASKIYPGNISDPKSLRVILEEMGLLDDVLPFARPTLVMNRGIATSDNLDLLREYQIPYILITRGPRNAAYLEEFEKHETDPDFVEFERNGRKIENIIDGIVVKKNISVPDSEQKQILDLLDVKLM